MLWARVLGAQMVVAVSPTAAKRDSAGLIPRLLMGDFAPGPGVDSTPASIIAGAPGGVNAPPPGRARRAVLLGLGGGTIAHLLVRRFGPISMIGVEADPEVLALARAEFGLDLPSLTVVEGDALAYVAACAERFDYVCVDLYRGAELERGALTRPFLRQLRALLLPGGIAFFNLFRDGRTGRRAHRIRQVFPWATEETVGK